VKTFRVLVAGVVAIVGAVALAIPAQATAPIVRATLVLRSQPGDWLGGGTTHRFRAGTVNGVTTRFFAEDLSPDRHVVGLSMTEENATSRLAQFILNIDAPNDRPLSVGHYAGSLSTLTDVHPMMDVEFGSAGCNQIFGDFSVLRLQRAADGHIITVSVSFRGHCEQPTAPMFSGLFRYDAR
jgi:hypothetical protein